MSDLISRETMTTHLVRAVENEANSIREKAIQDAVQAFEKSLREAVLKQAVNLTRFYDINRNGETVTLTVRVSE